MMQKTTAADIGKAIKSARKMLRLRQCDVAFASGTGVRFLVDLENDVRLYGKPVGVLEQIEGKLVFHLKSWAENQMEISYSLPIANHERKFSEKECKPFFEGLLPDSEEARKAIAKQHGCSDRNIFSLLRAIGAECAGAISFHSIDESVNPMQQTIVKADYKTDAEIEKYIKDKLRSNPLLNGIDDIRLSLAGVQDKICVVLDYKNAATAPIGLPHHGFPSTHIIKPEIPTFAHSAYNEYFCLSLAREVGLKAAYISFRKIGAIPCVVVERYDRKVVTHDNQTYINRLHQEDFCQALCKLPSQKYQNEGGPSLKDCFKVLNKISPVLVRDKLTFIDYVIFNFLVGNTDAHGKNFSLLYNPDSPMPRLAPLYDVLCCQIYSRQHSSKMAMKIGDKYLAKEVFKRHWESFCASINVSFPQFMKRAKELSRIINEKLDTLIEDEKIANPDYIDFAKELKCIIQNNIGDFLKRSGSIS
eukprot:gene25877-33823_t